MLYFVRKEVLVISISTAVLVNLVVTQRFLRTIQLPVTSTEMMGQVRSEHFIESYVEELGIIANLKELEYKSVISIFLIHEALHM
jgi:hypothetical protein